MTHPDDHSPGEQRAERPDSPLDSALRGSGLRMTAQRRRILDAVEKLGHATPDELDRELPEVNLSTIYRNLEVLEQLGLVRHAHLSDRAPTYHSVREPVHLHLVCRGCGEVNSIGVEAAASLVDQVVEQTGFVVDVGHLSLHGRCTNCEGDKK